MAPPIDYGSTLAFIFFLHELALIPILLMNSSRAGPNDGEPSSDHDSSRIIEADTDNAERLNDDMRFLYDVAARDNEGVVQNIDALDNGLIAVAVGIFAVALFVGDKWFVLEPTFRFVALTLLGESAIIALLGYFSTYLVKATELVRVGELIVEAGLYPKDAIERAITAFIVSGQSNRKVRLIKRTLVTAATSLTFVAAILCVVGRALGDTVHH
jgi:hypothetical protein